MTYANKVCNFNDCHIIARFTHISSKRRRCMITDKVIFGSSPLQTFNGDTFKYFGTSSTPHCMLIDLFSEFP